MRTWATSGARAALIAAGLLVIGTAAASPAAAFTTGMPGIPGGLVAGPAGFAAPPDARDPEHPDEGLRGRAAEACERSTTVLSAAAPVLGTEMCGDRPEEAAEPPVVEEPVEASRARARKFRRPMRGFNRGIGDGMVDSARDPLVREERDRGVLDVEPELEPEPEPLPTATPEPRVVPPTIGMVGALPPATQLPPPAPSTITTQQAATALPETGEYDLPDSDEQASGTGEVPAADEPLPEVEVLRPAPLEVAAGIAPSGGAADTARVLLGGLLLLALSGGVMFVWRQARPRRG